MIRIKKIIKMLFAIEFKNFRVDVLFKDVNILIKNCRLFFSTLASFKER